MSRNLIRLGQMNRADSYHLEYLPDFGRQPMAVSFRPCTKKKEDARVGQNCDDMAIRSYLRGKSPSHVYCNDFTNTLAVSLRVCNIKFFPLLPTHKP